MSACAAVGEVLFDDWVDWVLEGHHGEKQENTMRFKWRGLGNYSGPAKLYSLAKKQDPFWTSKLPSHLRFGAVGTAVGYTEFDPLPDFDSVIDTLEKKTMDMDPIPDTTVVKKLVDLNGHRMTWLKNVRVM